MAIKDILAYFVHQQQGTSIHAQGGLHGSFHVPPLPLVILGAGLFAYGFILYRQYQRLRDTPRSTVRAVAMGFTHVHGNTAAVETLEGPITKIPCCYYSSSIERWEDAHKRWTSISQNTRSCPFYIDDGTGRILVSPAGARFDLPKTYVRTIGGKESGSTHPDPTSNLYVDTTLNIVVPSDADLLDMKTAALSKQFSIQGFGEPRQQEMVNKAYPDDARYRFSETCLPLGREVAVFGTCRENPNSSDISMIVKDQRDKILMITSNSEAKAESNLRSRAIKIVVAGAVVLFLTFATCQPVIRTVPGSEAHSSK